MRRIKDGGVDVGTKGGKDVKKPKKQQGFKGGLLLTDTNRDKGIGIGLWETETTVGSSPRGKWGQKGWRGL